MQKIGLLSDTHGYFDPKYYSYFKDCDQIWHAGDIGSKEVLTGLSEVAPLRAVHGNIDGQEIRIIHPQVEVFHCEKVKVLLTHIGGYPQRYPLPILKLLQEHRPQLFICGHSHILKVIYDKSLQLLHINPGAAGKQGFHQVRTLVTFCIDNKEIKDLRVIELAQRI